MKASVLRATSFIGLIKNIINQISKCASQFIDKTGLATLLYLLFTSIHPYIFLWSSIYQGTLGDEHQKTVSQITIKHLLFPIHLECMPVKMHNKKTMFWALKKSQKQHDSYSCNYITVCFCGFLWKQPGFHNLLETLEIQGMLTLPYLAG